MELQVINTLNTNRHEIEAYIGSLKRDLEHARRDLSAIMAAIKVFSAEGPWVTAYLNLAKLFPRHSLPKLAQEALEVNPEGISHTSACSRLTMSAFILTRQGLTENA
jgi:hypothetical protein